MVFVQIDGIANGTNRAEEMTRRRTVKSDRNRDRNILSEMINICVGILKFHESFSVLSQAYSFLTQVLAHIGENSSKFPENLQVILV